MRAQRVAAVGLAMALMAIGCQSTQSKSDPPTDDTASLQARLDAMRPGDTLQLDPKVYSHSGVLLVRVPRVQIDGNGATLQATNDATSAVRIAADGVQLTNLRLTAPLQGPRMTALDQHKLVIDGNGDTVAHVQIDGSAAAGIFVNGAQNFTIRDVDVANTRADGVHMTEGAGPGVVDGVHTSQTGDDGVAVVSYRDAKPAHDITISGVDVASTRWGRGISVVGGNNVTVTGFNVASTNAAGVYVATEGEPYNTLPVSNVTIKDGSIRQANQNPEVVHGAILVTATNGTAVRDVNISNVDVSGTAPSAGRDVAVIADGGDVSGVSIDGIHLDNDAVTPFVGEAGPGSYHLQDWTIGGAPVSVS